MNGYLDCVLNYRQRGILRRHAHKVAARMYFGRRYRNV